MTPDIAAGTLPLSENQASATTGMTKKVVKGSLWILSAQIIPYIFTFATTPITIKLLGSEGYGVLVLVGLIPMYFSFADMGMGVASTRFASAALAKGDHKNEAEVVWTASGIALVTSLVFVAPVFILAGYIIPFLNVPAAMQSEATVALRFASAAFVLTLLGNVFNTPQLSRLRMDLNGLIGGTGRVIMALLAPLVIYLGFGIVGATVVSFVIAAVTLTAHFFTSASLLRELRIVSFNRQMANAIFTFGLGVFFSGIAAALLANFEKFLLPKFVSVEALAYYSVAFSFASMTTMFAIAMVQSLVPAFSQLTAPERRKEFNLLFSRAIRLNLIWLPPVAAFLFIVARPFFTVWAGEDFGRESTIPFYVLLAGLVLNLVAYVPYSSMTAFGRTDILAKVSWIQSGFFAVASLVLVSTFGILGAALAWTLRVSIDSFVVIWLSQRFASVEFRFTRYFVYLAIGLTVFSVPILFSVYAEGFWIGIILLFSVFLSIYVILVWKFMFDETERSWIVQWAKSVLRY